MLWWSEFYKCESSSLFLFRDRNGFRLCWLCFGHTLEHLHQRINLCRPVTLTQPCFFFFFFCSFAVIKTSYGKSELCYGIACCYAYRNACLMCVVLEDSEVVLQGWKGARNAFWLLHKRGFGCRLSLSITVQHALWPIGLLGTALGAEFD